MNKRQLIVNVSDIRESFTAYRKRLEELLVESYTIETKLVNRIVGLENSLYNLHCDIADGKIQNNE